MVDRMKYIIETDIGPNDEEHGKVEEHLDFTIKKETGTGDERPHVFTHLKAVKAGIREVPQAFRPNLEAILEHLWEDEKRHFEETAEEAAEE